MVAVVVAIIALSAPHLSFTYLEPSHTSFSKNWVAFVGVILALSGVEAIANLTGVMTLDPKASANAPSVAITSKKAIWPVAIEVVLGTALLGWAMLSLPHSLSDEIKNRYADMLRFLGEEYGSMALGPYFGHVFGAVVGLVVGLLLLSAVNTAVGAMIGLIYMLARDREMPRPFAKLNSHGVPWQPLLVATVLPIILVILSDDLDSLADMYAIGVVGAITVNLGSSCFNKRLKLNWREFTIMVVTFAILFAIEITIAKTKPAALFFATCVLLLGFGLRWYAMKRAGIETVMLTKEMAAALVPPERLENLRPNFAPGQAILVAARGFTPVLRFALEEARLRQGNLYVLYIKQLAVNLPGPLADPERPRWQNDRQAAEIMYGMYDLAQNSGVKVLPVYAVSENPAATIIDIAATIGVDMLMLGAPHRNSMAKLLRGDMVAEVAQGPSRKHPAHHSQLSGDREMLPAKSGNPGEIRCCCAKGNSQFYRVPFSRRCKALLSAQFDQHESSFSSLARSLLDWYLRKYKFRAGKNGCRRQRRINFPTAASNRRVWLLGECGGCRKVPAASHLDCPAKRDPSAMETFFNLRCRRMLSLSKTQQRLESCDFRR